MVDLLDCTVMPYAWGSRTALAELTGRPAPSAQPEAELWMGAHPQAPSRVTRDGHARSLADLIARDATRELGAEVAAAFGPRLPFLLKVLAAAQPLSLQAHPDAARAAEGFAEVERRGVPRDAPTRNYKDTSHKPELLCALAPVDALCGFRRAEDTLRLFDELGVPELEPMVAELRASTDARGLEATFGALMALPAERAAVVARATAAASAARGPGSAFAREHAWIERLAALYPGDVGVVVALLLNLVHLEVGEAIYLGAGNLHAYLGGVGVELMASSDNVLRGGLTQKHVDVPELTRVLDFQDGPVAPLTARPLAAHERTWDTPAREFRLSAIDVAGDAAIEREARGPELLLCTEGAAELRPARSGPAVALAKGAAAFVPGSTGRYALTAGSGRGAYVFRATVNFT